MTIHIEALTFPAIIGILDSEHITPQEVIVDSTIDYCYRNNNFINYAELIATIESQIIEKKYGLLEDALTDVALLDSSKVLIKSDNPNADGEADIRLNKTVEAGGELVLYIAADTVDDLTVGNNDGLDLTINVTSVEVDSDDTTVEGDAFATATLSLEKNYQTDQFDAKITREESAAKIGENDVKISKVRVDNDTNYDQTLRSLKLQRTGVNDADDDLSDVKIKIDGHTYKATQDDDEYTFDFGADGVTIASDDDVRLTVTADIEDGATHTIALNIQDIIVEDKDGKILNDKDAGDTAGAGE